MAEYSKNNRSKFIRTPEQKGIYNTRRREEYASNNEFRKQVKEKVKNWQHNNPSKRRNQRLSKYGITLEQFNDMLEKQNGKCAVCGYSDTSDTNFFPVVDHCHDTGKVRGILCMNCNMGIGKFKDNEIYLYNALVYLKGDIIGQLVNMVQS